MGLIILLVFKSWMSFAFMTDVLASEKVHSDFEVVTWNIHKGNNLGWGSYVLLNSKVDYWAIQEAVSQPEVLDFLESILNVNYNPAWSNSRRSTGTLNASKKMPLDYVGVVTYVSEPVSNTPKSFIVSDYDFGCKHNVRIVNTHMINFLVGDGYQKHLKQIQEYLENYKGPLIVLGDFNNWNWLRTNTLLNWTEDLNLNLAFEGNYKIKGLDHIFYRGLKLVSFQKVIVKLSDHEPIHAQFQCVS